MKTAFNILSLLILVKSIFGITIYIPQDYPTIQDGLYAASSGDTVLVAPGTYGGFMWSGISLQDVTVLGSGAWGDSVTRLQGNVITNGIYLEDVTGWEIAGFEVTNFTTGISVEHCHYINIHHNYSHHNPYSHAYGIHLESNDNFSIHHNILANNHYVALRINSDCDTISIVNNTIVYTESYHGIMVCEYTPGLEIVNNIIAYNNGDGIQFIPGSTQGDAVITYNDNYGNGNAWNNCTPGIGNILLNPLFTNIPPSLYALQRNSPCIDAGDPNSPLDPDGTRADIGAIFFDQQPPPIVSLTISLSGSDLILNWDDMPGVNYYHIYRQEEPFFSVIGLTPRDSVLNSTYNDTSAVNQNRLYYIVTWDR